jgi:NADPH2:quinone reductase
VHSKAIRIHSPGGPEALRWEEIDVGAPGHGEALVRHTAVGVNYVDVYHRRGLYPVPGLPAVIGVEAAGVVEATGAGVTAVAVGERVAYAGGPLGAYAERSLVPAERLVRLPTSISDEQAAAMMLKGLTAQYLLRRTYRVKPGDTILFHAAAGGVGLIACQWAKHLGATVIGTAGSDAKAALARVHGCDHVVVYTRERFPERVRALTSRAGVPVVYDSVGRRPSRARSTAWRPAGSW